MIEEYLFQTMKPVREDTVRYNTNGRYLRKPETCL